MTVWWSTLATALLAWRPTLALDETSSRSAREGIASGQESPPHAASPRYWEPPADFPAEYEQAPQPEYDRPPPAGRHDHPAYQEAYPPYRERDPRLDGRRDPPSNADPRPRPDYGPLPHPADRSQRDYYDTLPRREGYKTPWPPDARRPEEYPPPRSAPAPSWPEEQPGYSDREPPYPGRTPYAPGPRHDTRPGPRGTLDPYDRPPVHPDATPRRSPDERSSPDGSRGPTGIQWQ